MLNGSHIVIAAIIVPLIVASYQIVQSIGIQSDMNLNIDPDDIHYVPAGDSEVIINNTSSDLTVIDLAAKDIRKESMITDHKEDNKSRPAIEVGKGPQDLAINPITNTIYVTNYLSSHNVSVIDGNSDTVIGNIELNETHDIQQMDIDINPSTNKLYLVNHASVIDASSVSDKCSDPKND